MLIVFKKISLSVIVLFFIPVFAGEKEAKLVIEQDADQRIKAADESYALVKDRPLPEGYKHCRWNDVEKEKQANSFYRSKYETAINTCKGQWFHQSGYIWAGLELADKSPTRKNDYQIALDVFRGSRYQGAAEGSAVRDLNDKVIALFEGGTSKVASQTQSYFACVEWAELDPHQILSGFEYNGPLNKEKMAIAKGYLNCD